MEAVYREEVKTRIGPSEVGGRLREERKPRFVTPWMAGNERKTEMSTTTLTIVLQGLLALVPNNGPGGANQMTVLMLDGNQSHDVQCMDEHNPHVPKLIIRADNAKCRQAECRPVGGLC